MNPLPVIASCCDWLVVFSALNANLTHSCTAGKQRCYSLDISAARNNKSRDGIVQFGALAGIIASVYGPVPARTSERWLKKVENKKRFNSRGKLRFLQSSL